MINNKYYYKNIYVLLHKLKSIIRYLILCQLDTNIIKKIKTNNKYYYR